MPADVTGGGGGGSGGGGGGGGGEKGGCEGGRDDPRPPPPRALESHMLVGLVPNEHVSATSPRVAILLVAIGHKVTPLQTTLLYMDNP